MKELFKSIDEMEKFYQWFNNAGNDNMRELGFSHYHRDFLGGTLENKKKMVLAWEESMQDGSEFEIPNL